jgi:hypothetical protein
MSHEILHRGRLLAVATVLALVLFPARPSAAQGLPRPTLRLEAGLAAEAAFDDPPLGELAGGEAGVATSTGAATFSLPVVLGGGHTLLFLEAGWRELHLGRRHWPAAISADPDRLQEVSVAVTGRTRLGTDWALTARINPLLASDFRSGDLQDGDFKIQGAVIAERNLGPRWTLGLGAAYASTFGEPLPLPLLVARFAGDDWLLDATLPSSVLLVRHLSPRVDAGLSLTAEGSLYHIPRVFPESVGIDDPQLQYIAVHAGPVLTLRPVDAVLLTLRGGVAYQSLRVFDGTQEIPGTNYDLELSPFARISLDLMF